MPFFLALLFFLVVTAGGVSGGEPVSNSARGTGHEHWLGEVRIADRTFLFKLHLSADGSTRSATCDFLPTGPSARPVVLSKWEPGEIKLDLTQGDSSLHFTGKRQGEEIAGTVTNSNAKGTFRLRPIALISPLEMQEYAGSYRSPSGDLIRINRDGGYYGLDPTFLDYSSLRFGPMFPVAKDEFISGQDFSTTLFPHDGRIRFQRNARGKITGLVYRQGSRRAVHALRLDFPEEDLRLESHGIQLGCTLTLPLERGPYPAVHLINSSGAETRDFGFWRTFFASRGMAVLGCDKRGVGTSTGDWRQADFDDAANDVEEAVKFLQKRREVDPSRIGLWTISQGGWVAPIVASRSSSIAFLIVHSGAMVTAYEQGMQAIRSELEALNYTPADIEASLKFARADQNFTRTGQGWDELQELYQTGAAQHAFWAHEPAAKDFWFRAWYRATMDFDPVPFWEKVKCPVLAFFGERDITVRPEPSKTILAAALARGGNQDVTIKVVPRGSHGYLDVETGLVRRDLPRVKKFAEGYFAPMDEWLRARVLRPNLPNGRTKAN